MFEVLLGENRYLVIAIPLTVTAMLLLTMGLLFFLAGTPGFGLLLLGGLIAANAALLVKLGHGMKRGIRPKKKLRNTAK